MNKYICLCAYSVTSMTVTRFSSSSSRMPADGSNKQCVLDIYIMCIQANLLPASSPLWRRQTTLPSACAPRQWWLPVPSSGVFPNNLTPWVLVVQQKLLRLVSLFFFFPFFFFFFFCWPTSSDLILFQTFNHNHDLNITIDVGDLFFITRFLLLDLYSKGHLGNQNKKVPELQSWFFDHQHLFFW